MMVTRLLYYIIFVGLILTQFDKLNLHVMFYFIHYMYTMVHYNENILLKLQSIYSYTEHVKMN